MVKNKLINFIAAVRGETVARQTNYDQTKVKELEEVKNMIAEKEDQWLRVS
jgi:hypothetical protein